MTFHLPRAHRSRRLKPSGLNDRGPALRARLSSGTPRASPEFRRRGAEGLRGGLVHTLTGGGGAPAGAAAARASGTGRSWPGGACPSGRASGPTPPALGPRAGPRLPGSGRRRGRLGPGDEEAVSGRQRRGAEVAVGSAPGPPVPRVAGRQARAAQGHLQALPAASASRPRLPKTLAPPGRSDRRPPSMRSPSARGAGR